MTCFLEKIKPFFDKNSLESPIFAKKTAAIIGLPWFYNECAED